MIKFYIGRRLLKILVIYSCTIDDSRRITGVSMDFNLSESILATKLFCSTSTDTSQLLKCLMNQLNLRIEFPYFLFIIFRRYVTHLFVYFVYRNDSHAFRLLKPNKKYSFYRKLYSKSLREILLNI
jgi:hypothetical protein